MGYNRCHALAVGISKGSLITLPAVTNPAVVFVCLPIITNVQQQLSMSCNSQFLNNGRKDSAFIPVFGIIVNLLVDVQQAESIFNLPLN